VSDGASSSEARQDRSKGGTRRIVFVTGNGRLDPASHKRVYDLLPLFRERGYRCRVLTHRPELLWRLRLAANCGDWRARRLLWLGNATRVTPAWLRVRERSMLVRFSRALRWADVVVLQQTFLDAAWRQVLWQHARRLVYEFDDAVWLADGDAFRQMCERADLVVAGSDYLAGRAEAEPRRVAMIPTCVAVHRYPEHRPRSSGRDALIVGWVGSPASARYLSLLVEPLARVGEGREVVVRLVGTGPAPIPAFRNVGLQIDPRIPYDPVQIVPGFDVGVMPLLLGEIERGKCGAKALEYMAAGIPAVCSRTGNADVIIRHRVDGFIVETPDEWTATLAELAADPDLRHRVGAAGRMRVLQGYSTRMAVDRWHDCLDRLLADEASKQNSLPITEARVGRA
jgi:glycosyltransferase involved in cell wall biosynthesis